MKKNDKMPRKEYLVQESRYETMQYKKCGASGLKLPLLSLGLWHNFGEGDNQFNARQILRKAFDLGITYFDLANNYGPPYGSAEETFGMLLASDFSRYRDELVIATKAGYDMWDGPYGNGGSKKYLLASLDQSLKRMGLDYVDIFYHHRPDAETPLEESMSALDLLVRQGKALYIGLSNYREDDLKKATLILKSLGTPCVVNQIRYNMFDRWSEEGTLQQAKECGVGTVAFSPLAQGQLTSKYLAGVPEGSRAAKMNTYLSTDVVSSQIEKVRELSKIAQQRNQTMAQLALAWLLKDNYVTSVLVGASSPEQLENSVVALDNCSFSTEELQAIATILS